MDLMTAIAGIPGIGPFLPYIVLAVALAAALARFLPPPRTNTGAYRFLYNVVNWTAQNLGHARNATAPDGTPPAPSVSAAAILLLACGLALSACEGIPVTGGTVDVAAVRQDAQKAIDLYGVAKGIALVAEISDPTLVPIVSAGIAKADPIVAQAQLVLQATSGTDPAALQALVAQLVTAANALTVESAAQVTVVPSKT